MSQFTDEYITDQIQKRYFFHHILKLSDLCYGDVVKNNERINESHLPQFIQCINKLNDAVSLIQITSNELAEQQ
jgi:hypothetical protein